MITPDSSFAIVWRFLNPQRPAAFASENKAKEMGRDTKLDDDTSKNIAPCPVGLNLDDRRKEVRGTWLEETIPRMSLLFCVKILHFGGVGLMRGSTRDHPSTRRMMEGTKGPFKRQ